MIYKSVCILMLAATTWAADVTGKWTGNGEATAPNGEVRRETISLELRQSGSELSGMIGSKNGQEFPISKGAIDGNTVSFEVKSGEDGPTWRFKLTLNGDEMSGEANGEKGTETMKGRVTFKRS
jgi:hypothetical protein